MKNYFKYNHYLLKNGKSEKTINQYLYYLKKFFSWYEENITEEFYCLKKEVVEEYIYFVSQNSNDTTVNCHINFLRSYNNFLVDSGMQKEIVVNIDNRIKIQKRKNSIEKSIDSDYMERLIHKVFQQDGLKNYTIFMLMAYAGLRAIEVTELRTQDINLEKRMINISGKYGRTVPITYKLEGCLKMYIRQMEINQELLFINERDMQYTDKGIHWILRKNCLNNNITVGSFREFYSNRLINQGYSKKEIDKLLGYTTKRKNYISDEVKEMLSTGEAAKELGVAKATIIKWCEENKIKYFKTEKGFRKIPDYEIDRMKMKAKQ